jgi:SAM-dependent methyltransferase
MTGSDLPKATKFDEFARSYDHALAQGLSATGEDREFFARGRIQLLKRELDRLQFRPENVMEFGCGTGSNLSLLLESTRAKSILGIDESEKSLELARRSVDGSRAIFARPSQYRPAGRIDLAFCNGVFHHIDPAMRASAAEYVRDCLRPGGIFALWENNPWNPGTRYVMSRIPFDKDAITLTAAEGCRLLREAGFSILSTRYSFIFPHALRLLRMFEASVSKLPLGGQYQVLARKLSP